MFKSFLMIRCILYALTIKQVADLKETHRVRKEENLLGA